MVLTINLIFFILVPKLKLEMELAVVIKRNVKVKMPAVVLKLKVALVKDLTVEFDAERFL